MSQAKRYRAPTDDGPIVRWLLIALGVGYIALFLLTPLIAVFVEALRNGIGASLEALMDPDAQSAIWLTLTVAAIAVPLNTLFGLAAAWSIANCKCVRPSASALARRSACCLPET